MQLRNSVIFTCGIPEAKAEDWLFFLVEVGVGVVERALEFFIGCGTEEQSSSEFIILGIFDNGKG